MDTPLKEHDESPERTSAPLPADAVVVGFEGSLDGAAFEPEVDLRMIRRISCGKVEYY